MKYVKSLALKAPTNTLEPHILKISRLRLKLAARRMAFLNATSARRSRR